MQQLRSLFEKLGIGNRQAQVEDCPESPAIQGDFQVSRYCGLWYERYRSQNIPFESGSNITARYEPSPQAADQILILNRQYMPESGEWQDIQGTGTLVSHSPDPKGHLLVKFRFWLPAGDYRVLKTDYEHYSVVYSEVCYLGWYWTRYVWILTRTAEPIEAGLLKELFDLIESKLGVKPESLLETPIEQCRE